jgi:hypothetical protein
MANLDRSRVIELLERLGAESDEAALHAARELHRAVGEAGVSWDELLRPDDTDADDTDADGGLADDDPPDVEPAEPAPRKAAAPDRAEDARLLDRLLARKNLSQEMREELARLKQDLAEGEFDATDSEYVRALAKRLGG